MRLTSQRLAHAQTIVVTAEYTTMRKKLLPILKVETRKKWAVSNLSVILLGL